jgi:hypothetical protein
MKMGAAGSPETSLKFMLDTALHSIEQHSSKKNCFETHLETTTPIEPTDDGISTHWLYG